MDRDPGLYACPECHNPMLIKSLIRHLRNFHGYSNQKAYAFRESDDGQGFECGYCSNVLHTEHSIDKHIISREHKRKPRSLPCPMCETEEHSQRSLIRHFNQNHVTDGIPYCDIVSKKFPNEEIFKAWLTDQSIVSPPGFSMTSKKLVDDYFIQYYQCRHVAAFQQQVKVKNGDRIAIKSYHSCTAFLKAIVKLKKGEGVEMEGCLTHNHNFSLRPVPVSVLAHDKIQENGDMPSTSKTNRSRVASRPQAKPCKRAPNDHLTYVLIELLEDDTEKFMKLLDFMGSNRMKFKIGRDKSELFESNCNTECSENKRTKINEPKLNTTSDAGLIPVKDESFEPMIEQQPLNAADLLQSGEGDSPMDSSGRSVEPINAAELMKQTTSTSAIQSTKSSDIAPPVDSASFLIPTSSSLAATSVKSSQLMQPTSRSRRVHSSNTTLHHPSQTIELKSKYKTASYTASKKKPKASSPADTNGIPTVTVRHLLMASKKPENVKNIAEANQVVCFVKGRLNPQLLYKVTRGEICRRTEHMTLRMIGFLLQQPTDIKCHQIRQLLDSNGISVSVRQVAKYPSSLSLLAEDEAKIIAREFSSITLCEFPISAISGKLYSNAKSYDDRQVLVQDALSAARFLLNIKCILERVHVPLGDQTIIVRDTYQPLQDGMERYSTYTHGFGPHVSFCMAEVMYKIAIATTQLFTGSD